MLHNVQLYWTNINNILGGITLWVYLMGQLRKNNMNNKTTMINVYIGLLKAISVSEGKMHMWEKREENSIDISYINDC